MLVFDEPRRLELDLSASASFGLDRLPEYQNVAIDVDRLYGFDAKLSYTDVRNSLGAVDDETGSRWSTVWQTRVADGSIAPRLYATYDRGLATPMRHSSVWFRSAAGYAPRVTAQPFASFYFGAFGNNYVDHWDEKRYRQYFAFPGIDLNAIDGRHFVKTVVEWNLPPWRFSRLGTPGSYASWLRPAFFWGALQTNFGSARERRFISNVGGQLDLRLAVLSELDMTVSFGGAVAFDRDGAHRRELMMSLKLLR